VDQLLISPKALAVALGLAEQTIYNRHSTGGNLPPCIKLGRLLRFRPSDVEAWLARQLSSSGQQPVAAGAQAVKRDGRSTKAEQLAAPHSL